PRPVNASLYSFSTISARSPSYEPKNQPGVGSSNVSRNGPQNSELTWGKYWKTEEGSSRAVAGRSSAGDTPSDTRHKAHASARARVGIGFSPRAGPVRRPRTTGRRGSNPLDARPIYLSVRERGEFGQ